MPVSHVTSHVMCHVTLVLSMCLFLQVANRLYAISTELERTFRFSENEEFVVQYVEIENWSVCVCW